MGYSLVVSLHAGPGNSSVVRMQILEQNLQSRFSSFFKIGADISPGEKSISGLVFFQGQFKNPVGKPFLAEFYVTGDGDHFFVLHRIISCNNSNQG